jgi:hypothetical protein
MRARGLTAPLSRVGGPSYREAKGGDVQPVPLVLLRVYGHVRLPRGRVAPSFSRTLRKGGIPRPRRAWALPNLTTCLFHHNFLVRPSQTPNRNRAIIRLRAGSREDEQW